MGATATPALARRRDAELNEPLGIGDVASLRFLTSGGGLNYVRASYQAQIQALTVGVAYAHLGYRLGREFKPLDADGAVDVASLYRSLDPAWRATAFRLDLTGVRCWPRRRPPNLAHRAAPLGEERDDYRTRTQSDTFRPRGGGRS